MKVFTGTTKGFTGTTKDFTGRTKVFTGRTAGGMAEYSSRPNSTTSGVDNTADSQETAEATLATKTQHPLFQNMTTRQIFTNTTINEATSTVQDTVTTMTENTFAASELFSARPKTSTEFSFASEEVVAPAGVAEGAVGVAGAAADAAINVAGGALNAAAGAAGAAADAVGAAADAAVNTAGAAADAAVNVAGAAVDAAAAAALGAIGGVLGS